MTNEDLETVLEMHIIKCIKRIPALQLKRGIKNGGRLYIYGRLDDPFNYQIKYAETYPFQFPFTEVHGALFFGRKAEDFREHLLFFADVFAMQLARDLKFGKWVMKSHTEEEIFNLSKNIFHEESLATRAIFSGEAILSSRPER